MQRIAKPNWLKNPDMWLPKSLTESIPGYTFADDKVLTMVNKITGSTPASRAHLGGITHFQTTDAPFDVQLLWFHAIYWQNSGKPPGSPYGTANMTEQDCINVANSIGMASFNMDEMGEGSYGMPYTAPQQKLFYQALQARYQAAGKPFRHGGTYGGFQYMQPNNWEYFNFTGGNQVMPNDSRFKAYLLSKNKAREGSQYYFDNFAPYGIGANVKNYIDRPDYTHLTHMKIFETQAMCLGFGRVGGVGGTGQVYYVDWPYIEGLANGLHNGYYTSRRIKSPAGWVDQTEGEHPVVDHDWRVGTGFICGFVEGHGWVQFGTSNTYKTNPMTMSSNQRWSPDVAGTNGPASINATTFAEYYATEQIRGQDAGPEAGWYYKQMESTTGQKWNYVPFRYAGSQNWVMPQTDVGSDNGPTTTILERASDWDGPFSQAQNARRGGPIVQVRIKNGICHGYAFDPSRHKNTYETLIVQVTPGKAVELNVQGSVLYPFSENV